MTNITHTPGEELTPSECGESFTVPTALLELGEVVATHGVLEATTALQRITCLTRHMRGDWGIVCDDDKASNLAALRDGSRILSAYLLDPEQPAKGRFWIITEADRSVTTFLLPSEY